MTQTKEAPTITAAETFWQQKNLTSNLKALSLKMPNCLKKISSQWYISVQSKLSAVQKVGHEKMGTYACLANFLSF